MDRQAALLNFSRCLGEAAGERNWEALMRVDGMLAAALPQLVAQGELSAGEHAALDELQRAHRQAGEHCARELATLAEKLDEMRTRRSGWRAYAASGDPEETQE